MFLLSCLVYQNYYLYSYFGFYFIFGLVIFLISLGFLYFYFDRFKAYLFAPNQPNSNDSPAIFFSILGASFVMTIFGAYQDNKYHNEVNAVYNYKIYETIEGKIHDYTYKKVERKAAIHYFYVGDIKFTSGFFRGLEDGIKIRVKYTQNISRDGENIILEIEDIDCVLHKL